MLPLIAGTAVAAVTLFIIHFFGLRLGQKLEFPHLQFLSVLISRTRSVRKIYNYFLLFLRLLFIASALCAFILYLVQGNRGQISTGVKATVLIDTSWSMQSSSSEKASTKLTLAAKDYKELQALLSPYNTGVSDNENDDETLSHHLSLSSSAADLLEQGDMTNRTSHTYIFSDFQRSVFTGTNLKKLSRKQHYTLVSYINENTSNLYVDSVWLDQPTLFPNSLADVFVQVAGSMLTERISVKITASENNSLLGTTQVFVEPGKKAIARFKIPLTVGAEKQIIFSVEDAATPFDNNFYVVLPKPMAVAIKIDEAISTSHPVIQAYATEPSFTITKGRAQEAKLWVYEIPSTGVGLSTVAAIKAWLDDGRSLVLLPNASAANSTIAFLDQLGLKGIREESNQIDAKALKEPDLSDAFFSQIFEKEVKNMRMPNVKPLLRWESAYHTILKFEDATPFLSTFRIGNGQVHLFASPLTSNSSFISHTLFVPVLYQLALTTSAAPIVLSHAPQNGTITIPIVPKDVANQQVALYNNGQTYIPDQKIFQNQLQMTLPKEISKPGFYTVTVAGKEVSSIALNIPRVESKLEGYTVGELKEILAEYGDKVNILEADEKISLQKQLQMEGTSSSLWKYCLILCFMCLIGEAVILSTKKSGSSI
ncbi:BatA domain-containing protein [Rufibacter immobilis]|uniref:BatA domain-containing protein n=1 Tax=Rufibacter immobilis TaxID=1348778 RepID=UPI0035E5BE00